MAANLPPAAGAMRQRRIAVDMDEREHEWVEAVLPATPEGERIANSVDAAIWAGTIAVDSAGRVRRDQYERILAAVRARCRQPGEKL